MRIAHLIMAHKSPALVSRLINKLDHAQFDFYIHLDAKSELSTFHELSSFSNVKFIKNRISCNWGGFSFVTAIVASLAEISQEKEDYAFINLLSGQDYPIKDASFIYDFYNKNLGKNFISYDITNNSAWWKDSVKRYQQYHLTDYKFKGKHLVEKVLNKVLPVRKFPGDIKLYGSTYSCWWTITGDCAESIVHRLNNDQKLTSFLELCWGTDEFIIATLIMNSKFKATVVNDNLRYIDWSEGNAHPKVLSTVDLLALKSSKALFARKFDANIDVEILNLIDSQQSKQLVTKSNT